MLDGNQQNGPLGELNGLSTSLIPLLMGIAAESESDYLY